MLRTIRVPAAVPLLTHNSSPLTPSDARKNTWLPTAVKKLANELLLPGFMSRTRRVPASVPSLVHTSRPLVSVVATKNSVPPTFTRVSGDEPEEPGSTSRTFASRPQCHHSPITLAHAHRRWPQKRADYRRLSNEESRSHLHPDEYL